MVKFPSTGEVWKAGLFEILETIFRYGAKTFGRLARFLNFGGNGLVPGKIVRWVCQKGFICGYERPKNVVGLIKWGGMGNRVLVLCASIVERRSDVQQIGVFVVDRV